ncbi:MAG: glycosyltransferase family 4 protein [Ignavibacteriaceae bacterium]|nr:glycosyltransferase family 4 protein [Ignavibacteriaceae bacterium]MCW8812514.1 glycosyltransferase family 4 protein [Chlorobium sp.]MCW8961179.1 glycosyltransferase family 4 protein [Ignavibacteriaceae bacterium]MCW9065592.1 glycosyltransferase family 4 protein [Ignavibacteriaceae bacterium]MCW9095276.1 glycosyltransferase family 4 protein [Ignavibacteriaceae bacterium]
MIKLLLSAFSEFPKSDVGGANKVIYQILRYIDYRKFSPAYYSSHVQKEFKNSNSLEQQISSSLKLKKKVGSNLFRKNKFIRGILTSSFYLNKYLVRNNKVYESLEYLKNFEVLHSHDFRSLYYLRNFNFRKKILTLHSKGSFINDLKYYAKNISTKLLDKYLQMENESMDIADIITFPSNAAKNLFCSEKDFSLDEEKVKIVYNGVDMDFIHSIIPEKNFFEKYSIPLGADLILINIADHIQIKNIDIVLRVVEYLKRMHKTRAVLINAGNGPETKHLKSMCNKLNINEQVKFLGRLTYYEIIKLLKVGDLLISTADNVIFDLIILEALASGLCVVASNNGGNKEVIQDSVNGYLVNDFSIEEFGKTILNIDKEIKSRAIDSAKKFDVKKMTADYQNVYAE